MAPRSAKRGAVRKSPTPSRSRKLKGSASDPSSPFPPSEDEATPELEVIPGDEEVPEMEAVYTPPPPDTVEDEEGPSTATDTEEITENKGLETGNDQDARKTASNEPLGVQDLSNENISQALSSFKEGLVGEGEAAPSLVEEEKTVEMELTLEKLKDVEEKTVEMELTLEQLKDVEDLSEDQDANKFEDFEAAEAQVGQLGVELHPEMVSQESELIVVRESEEILEDADLCDAGDMMKIDEDGSSNVVDGVVVVGVDVGHINVAYEENVGNEENDQVLSMQSALKEVKERKESEIFVGGLDRGAVEEDLVEVFGVFGDIQSVRIAKHPATKKSKGFAFISFASSEHAKKAISDLKDGIEVKGKVARIEACHDKSTLYLGNICKTWTRDQVMEKLTSYGVEQIENMILPEDLKFEGKIRGFAFLEFSSHSDAMEAFQCLRKPDVDFGRERTPKVAFAHTPLQPSQEVTLQTKTVYVEGIPLSWDEEKIQEICKKYGQVEEVRLPRNFGSHKRKSFGFVEFSSHESALAFVEGINSVQLGDGDAKVKANLAKSLSKGQLAKQGARGGSMAKKDGTTEKVGNSKKKKNAKFKSKEETQHKLKNVIESNPSASQIKGAKENISVKTSKSFKRKRQGGKPMHNFSHGIPSKRVKMHHNRNYVSEPQLRHSDLEPHAGYLSAANQISAPYEYDPRRFGAYDRELSNPGYARGQRGVQTSYSAYTGYANYQPHGYRYPNSGGYAPRRRNC